VPEARRADQSGQRSPALEAAGSVASPPVEPESSSADNEPDVAVPLDLTEHYHMKATAFGGITQYPWPAVPRGAQTFAGVPLEIDGAMFLWGERNATNGMSYPEQISGIGVAREFETLYVCHGAFFEGPPGTPVYEVVFHYDDGTTASDTIECGKDVRDWFANRADATLGPSGPRSTLAWDGDGKAGDRTQAIRFCLTAIANPQPDKEVTALDLVSSKTLSAGCILAITTGKADLMKRVETAPAVEERDN